MPPRQGIGRNVILDECRRLRARAYDLAITADTQEFTKLVDAWDKLTDRQRVIRGKPLPGVKKPSESPPSRSSSRPAVVPLPEVASEPPPAPVSVDAQAPDPQPDAKLFTGYSQSVDNPPEHPQG